MGNESAALKLSFFFYISSRFVLLLIPIKYWIIQYLPLYQIFRLLVILRKI